MAQRQLQSRGTTSLLPYSAGVVGYDADTKARARAVSSEFGFALPKGFTNAYSDQPAKEAALGAEAKDKKAVLPVQSGTVAVAAPGLDGVSRDRNESSVQGISTLEQRMARGAAYNVTNRQVRDGIASGAAPTATTRERERIAKMNALFQPKRPEPDRKDAHVAASLDMRQDRLQMAERQFLQQRRAAAKEAAEQMDTGKMAGQVLNRMQENVSKNMQSSVTMGDGKKAPMETVAWSQQQKDSISQEARLDDRKLKADVIRAVRKGVDPKEAMQQAQNKAVERVAQVVGKMEFKVEGEKAMTGATMSASKTSEAVSPKKEQSTDKQAAQSAVAMQSASSGNMISAETGRPIRGVSDVSSKVAAAQHSFHAAKVQAPPVKAEAAPVKAVAA